MHSPLTRLRTQDGFGFVSVLLALLLVAALYFGYFGMQDAMKGQRSTSIAALDATKAVACRTQRQALERDITFWSADHPDEQPTLAGLRQAGIHIPSCPEGGRYEIAGSRVECSVHR